LLRIVIEERVPENKIVQRTRVFEVELHAQAERRSGQTHLQRT
jgi:hypothetical protein